MTDADRRQRVLHDALVRDARAAIIALGPKDPKSKDVGHRLIVFDCHAASSEELKRFCRSGQGAALARGQVSILIVDSSFGASAIPSKGGLLRQTWLYDSVSKQWGMVIPATTEGQTVVAEHVNVRPDPLDSFHRLLGVYHYRGGALMRSLVGLMLLASVACTKAPASSGPPRRNLPRFRRHGLEAAAPEPCAAWDTWLTSVGPSAVTPLQLLVAECSTGEHAPVLTDLGPYRVRYESEDAPGIGSEYALALDPPHLEREKHYGHGPTLTWDYGAFSGQECEAGYCAPVMVEASVEDDAFAKGGWKTTDLGECSMQLEGQPAGGVTATPTSSVRLLESAGTLYVQVTDDAFVTKGPLVDELVFRAIFFEAMSPSEGRSARLRMDGQLTDWQGHVRHVDVADGPHTRRFALTDVWPEPDDQWHIAYEDTDDGRSRAPRLGNGQVPQEQWVFVSPFPCVPRDGVLHVDRDHGPKPDAQTALAP